MRAQLAAKRLASFWAFGLLVACLVLTPGVSGEELRPPAAETNPLSGLNQFQEWASRYSSLRTEPARSQLIREGLHLAKKRRQLLLALVQTDPQAVLSNSIPITLRQAIPQEIWSELETPVDGVGDLSVVCLLGKPGGDPGAPLRQYLSVGGKTFRAYSPNTTLVSATRKKVAVRGVAFDGLIAFDVGGTALPPSAEPAGVQTARRLLIVRVDFPDLQAAPDTGVYSADFLQSVMDSQVVPFFRRSSYGKMAMAYVVSPAIYRLPQRVGYYATTDIGYQLNADARVLVSADYDLGKYDSLVVVFPWLGNLPGSLITYGGMSEISGGNVWVNGEFDLRVLVHELAHNCGLSHANLWQVNDGNPLSTAGWNLEFGDPFDPMGANWFDDPRVDFNPWSKNQLGWLADSQAPTVTSNGIYRIHHFDNATASGPLALKVRRDGMRNYWVGWRGNFRDNESLQNGAYITWGYNLRQPSHLLDLTTPGVSAQDSALAVGTTLIDPEAALTITPIARGGLPPEEYLDVEILFGFSDPVIVQDPEDQSVLAGQTAAFRIEVSGNPPPRLQWQFSDFEGVTWTNVGVGSPYQGCTQTTLTIQPAVEGMSGRLFRCIATGASGQTLVSAPANLVVLRSAGPCLSAQRAGGTLVLSWSDLWAGYVLESCPQLSPETIWIPVTDPPALSDGMNVWTNRGEISPVFFRLRRE